MGAIRRGEPRAFEALYDRHSGELLSFCTYVLGSRADAEDALQATFAAAYRALRTAERPIALRPWLFTIARNQCLTILRRRQPTVELDGEPAVNGDPARELELREEVRDTLVRLSELPERQRAAMVLAELRGFSQAEIGSGLGVRSEQVKALVYQARSDLISDRLARETDCDEIREEISNARGAALLRGRLRRHVRSCEDCRTFAAGVARQRRQLNSFIPFAPSLLFKLRSLPEVFATGISEPTAYAGGATLGGTVAGAALELTGGGVKAIAVKVLAGAAILGLGTSVGASVTPNQPIARLAGMTHSSSASSRKAVERGGRGRAGSSARVLRGRGGLASGAGPGAGGGAYGATGGAAERRGASEPGASSDRSEAPSSPRSGPRAPAHQRGSAVHAPSALQQRQLTAEQHEQAREAREQRRSERLQQREEGKLAREERQRSNEERRGGASGRQLAAEERQHAQEQRQLEHEKAKRESERTRTKEQHQHEHEKAKREREREHAAAKRAHEREKAKREREREKARRQKAHEHGRRPPAPPAEEEAAE